jgi:hypothetical protein
LARQCPTNSKGIYPSGGNCDECGSVHHLKKDCPDVFGNEELGKDDVDAQIGRVSNPFVSTEYEEIPEEVPAAEDKEENEKEIKEPIPKKSKAFKRKQADPIEKDESDDTSLNSTKSSDKDKQPPMTAIQQKPTAPKKRRVKF